MKLLTKENRRLAINLTPLIDVLFILIIFFAVSSTFLEQPGIELDLPKAKSSEGHTTQRVIIYVDKDENIFLNDNIVSINNLIDEIKKLADIREDKSIVVKADAAVPHGLIITIMDLLRQQGIYKIVISTIKPQNSR